MVRTSATVANVHSLLNPTRLVNDPGFRLDAVNIRRVVGCAKRRKDTVESMFGRASVLRSGDSVEQ